MELNFGGFVPLSTVDWRGRAVCTLFLRGCPVRCHYCHNREIQSGRDMRPLEDILGMISQSRLLISGVIFSGGEPTMQKDALLALAEASRKMGLKIGVQTNGVFPDTLSALIEHNLLDLVHLDIKTRWEHYPLLLKVKSEQVENVRRSLALCKEAYQDKRLEGMEVVLTLFPGREDDVEYVAREAEGVDFVLQQGVEGSIPPLNFNDLKKLADSLERPVRIRTREYGEVLYDRNRIIIADSIELTDILQAERRY